MNAKMLVLVPTRGRPENARRLREAIDDTTGGEVAVLFCVDSDDKTHEEYRRVLPFHCLRSGEPARLGPWLNRMAAEMHAHYPVIGFMGDDHLPETQGWHDAVLAALAAAGKNGMAYGDDGLQGERLPTAVFMRTELIERLGWMVPPGLEHLYIDDAWKAIGSLAGSLRYLPDVKITHLHPSAGAAAIDETYRTANSVAQNASDKQKFHEFKRTVLPKLRGLLLE